MTPFIPRAAWHKVVYPLMAFPVSVSPGKGYRNHDGNTGNIVVNEPADGDVTTCGAGYACKVSATKTAK